MTRTWDSALIYLSWQRKPLPEGSLLDSNISTQSRSTDLYLLVGRKSGMATWCYKIYTHLSWVEYDHSIVVSRRTILISSRRRWRTKKCKIHHLRNFSSLFKNFVIDEFCWYIVQCHVLNKTIAIVHRLRLYSSSTTSSKAYRYKLNFI